MKTLNDNESYRRASEKLAQVQTDLRAKDTRLNQIYSKLTPMEARDPLQDAAERLLDGDEGALKLVPHHDALRSEVSQLLEEIRILRAAVELAKSRRDTAHAEASRAACLAAAPEHRKRVRAVCEAAVVLAEANAAERAIRDELESAGFNTGYLRSMSYRHVGQITDANSSIAMYLREALEQGYVTLPEFRKLTGGKVELPASLLASLKEVA